MTITLPLSSNLTPALSQFNPSVYGFLPVATRTWSAFKTWVSPPLTGWILTSAWVPWFFPDNTLCEVKILIPCLVRILLNDLASYLSREGQI